MILSAYCDDSANQDRSLVSIAGALAPPLDWIQFSYRWQRLLDEWGLEFFHMADFEAGRPPYNWEPHIRRERLNQLLALIEAYDLALFGSSVPRAWFEAFASPIARKHWQGTLGLAAQLAFIMVANQGRKYLEAKDATIAYFFERGVKGWGQIEKQFNYVADRQPKWHLQTIETVPKVGFPPVQAADLIAYEANKEMLRFLDLPGAPPKKRYPMERLEANQHFWSYVRQDTIRLMSDAIDRGMFEAELKRVLMGRRTFTANIRFGDEPKTIQQIIEESL